MGKRWIWTVLSGCLGLLVPGAAHAQPGPFEPTPEAPVVDAFQEPVRPRTAFEDESKPCCSPTCFSLRGEAVWYWMRPNNPGFPLATIGSVADPVPGALGQPGTQVIGQEAYTWQPSIAGKLTGIWRPECLPAISSENTIFGTEQSSRGFGLSSTGAAGTPVLARPFFNPVANAQDADPRAIPGVMSGNISYGFRTRMAGAETNLRYELGDVSCAHELRVLVGVRMLYLDETYASDEFAQDLPPNPANRFLISDNFTTRNLFVGGQVGLQYQHHLQCLIFDFGAKVAFGNNFRRVGISGLTTITNQTGASVADNQGLFAQPLNIGAFTSNAFSILPEFSLGVTLPLSDRIKISAGYSFLMMTNVTRPQDVLDRTINIQPLLAPGQVGPALPGVPRDRDSLFYAHSVSVGLQLDF